MNKNEALDILRDLHEKSLFSERTALETIVPELAESEDEKIRKDLISLLNSSINGKKVFSINDTTRKQMIAWLEKQVSPDMVADAYLRGCNDTEKKWLESKRYTKMDVDNAYLEGIANAKRELEKQGEMGIEMDIEKPITIGKCKLTGKAAELAKEVTPESLEEAKEKLNAEEEFNKCLNKEIQDWFESGPPSSLPWCTVKDAIELTARHFFELGFEHKQKVLTEKDIKMIDILCCIFEVSDTYYKVDRQGQYAISSKEILDWLIKFKKKML